MVTTQSKFEDGQTVNAPKFEVVIISGDELLRGWRYKCGFPNKKGGVNKKRSPYYFWETELTAKMT